MKKIVQTAGRTQLGEFAPEFAHLNDDILFGEVWLSLIHISLGFLRLVFVNAVHDECNCIDSKEIVGEITIGK